MVMMTTGMMTTMMSHLPSVIYLISVGFLTPVTESGDHKWVCSLNLSSSAVRPSFINLAGTMAWVQKQINQGVDPRDVLQKLGNLSSHIPVSLDDTTLWKIIVSVLSEPPRREKLSHVNTMTDVVKLLKEAKNIIVLTGAGVILDYIINDMGSNFKHCHFLGVSFLWNTRFPQSRRNLLPVGYGFPRSSGPPGHV
jgi:hypothetical protein